MTNLIETARLEIKSLVENGFKKAIQNKALPEAELNPFVVEIPADLSHGDFATNVAMVNARSFRQAPQKIATAIVSEFDFSSCKYIKSAEIAGAGFINFWLKDSFYADTVSSAIREGEDYGKTDYGKGKKVMVEFVSANPTGPMHMGNARGGAIGDILAEALSRSGYEVTREFYINDAGNQIEKFGLSLEVRYLQHFKGEENVPLPEDCYQGEDIKDRAEEYIAKYGDCLLDKSREERKKSLVDFALPLNIAKLKSDLEQYRIFYDVWFKESQLHESGLVNEIIAKLGEKGLSYEKDGAIWYKATEFGGEKDEVLVRANGIPTYFAADIAYHYNKFVIRKFDKVINVWGADHHGHVARLKGAMDALGVGGDKLDIVLMQLVRLLRDGKPYKMSKRTGKAVSLTDLIAEVPIDAARFFFNMREPNSTLDFDLDLAAEQSKENPVYYVQYAHVRICSILKKLGIDYNDAVSILEKADLSLLSEPEARELIRQIAIFPEEIVTSAKNYDPARLTRYSLELASLFHKFYGAVRVSGCEEELQRARIALCLATKSVLKTSLELLKIEVPEAM